MGEHRNRADRMLSSGKRKKKPKPNPFFVFWLTERQADSFKRPVACSACLQLEAPQQFFVCLFFLFPIVYCNTFSRLFILCVFQWNSILFSPAPFLFRAAASVLHLLRGSSPDIWNYAVVFSACLFYLCLNGKKILLAPVLGSPSASLTRAALCLNLRTASATWRNDPQDEEFINILLIFVSALWIFRHKSRGPNIKLLTHSIVFL